MKAALLLTALAAPPSAFVPASDVLEPGAMTWREAAVPLDAVPEGPLEARVLAITHVGPARIWPYARVLSAGRGEARVRYPVGAAPRGSGPGVGRATLVVMARGDARALGREPVEHVLRVRGEPEPADVDALEAAHAGWMRQAGETGDPRRSPFLARPARAALGAPDPAFAAARVEAAAVRARLRAELFSAEPRARAALAALARLEGPQGARWRRARPLERTVRETLDAADAHLRRGRLPVAGELVRSVRASAAARPRELARALVLEAALAVGRGHVTEAERLIGQSRCLAPDVSTAIGLPVLAALAAPAFEADPCRGRQIEVGQVAATRVGVETAEAGLSVQVEVEHDPAHLVATVLVERLGPGGGPRGSREARVEPGRPAEVTFVGRREALHAPIRASLRVELRDRFGATVARRGARDPLVVRLRDGPGVGGLVVPDWVWVALGGAAVVGAGVAVGLAVGDGGGVERVVGPVSVSF